MHKTVLNITSQAWRCMTSQMMFLVTLVSDVKTAGYLHTNLHQAICCEAYAFFCFCSCRWVPQHLLMLHPGSKYFNLLILSGGNFFFLCQPVETPHGKQWLATRSQLISWLVSQSVSFGHSAKLMNQSASAFARVPNWWASHWSASALAQVPNW